MSKIVVRPATREDIDTFSSMADAPTVKAIVGELNGEIIAMGGLALARGRWFAFLDLTPQARPYRMHIMRAAKRVLAEARRDGIRFIYWQVDPNEPRAVAWLTSLGFELDPRSQYLYRWSA